MRRLSMRAAVAAFYFLVLSALVHPAATEQTTGELAAGKGVCVWINSHWYCP